MFVRDEGWGRPEDCFMVPEFCFYKHKQYLCLTMISGPSPMTSKLGSSINHAHMSSDALYFTADDRPTFR